MRIVCPSCAAVYDVPDGRLVPGQFVRCARCSANWAALDEPTFPERALSGPAPPEVSVLVMADPVPISRKTEAVPASEMPSAPSSRPLSALAATPAVIAGWIVTVAILIGLVWATVTWRNEVMRAWPPSERLFGVIGLLADR